MKEYSHGDYSTDLAVLGIFEASVLYAKSWATGIGRPTTIGAADVHCWHLAGLT
jgi:hypothetical protein